MIPKESVNILAAEKGADPAIIEKDYVLHWLLKGLYSTKPFRESLALKGGTALRMVYFPQNWRCSIDLDFTWLEIEKYDTNEENDAVREAIEDALNYVKENTDMDIRVDQFNITKDAEGNPVYGNGRIKYGGNFERRNIKLDVSFLEKLIHTPVIKEITPSYADIGKFEILSYTLEEIIIEKIRSLMQRARSRDYYDVWRLLRENEFNLSEILADVRQKCSMTQPPVEFNLSKIADEDRAKQVEDYWEKGLGGLVGTVPLFSEILKELERILQNSENSGNII